MAERRRTALKGGTLSDIWLYVRYQVLSKLFLALVVMPSYRFVAGWLIASRGRTSVTSGDFADFVFSLPGLGLAVLTTLLVGFLVVLDIAAFVIAELARLRGEPPRTGRALLLEALRSIPRFLHPATLLFLLYVALVVPLVKLGPSLTALDWVQVPNFVTDVIVRNPVFLSLYIGVLTLIGVLAFFLIVTVQAMFVHDLDPWRAMRASTRFVARHWWSVIVTLVRGPLILGSAVLLAAAVLIVGLLVLTALLPEDVLAVRFSAVLISVVAAAVMGFLVFVLVPIELRNLTRTYAVLDDAIPADAREDVRAADRGARPRLLAAGAGALAAALVVAALGALFFDEVFGQDRAIEVIAHRGGGDLDAENSVEGVQAAAAAGIPWSEIDIQRTRDGAYVVNHDATFARLSGDQRSSSEMTLAEIQELSITNTFQPGAPARPVPTIEQMLDAAAGRIGLFVELKGDTADRRMVDDMAALVRERDMVGSVVLIGLDLDLMAYAESTHPDLLTGYLYYFGVGDTADLDFDFLIIEEGVASPSRVEDLQSAGRRVVVWTVNTEDSIDRFAGSRVDGIITDVPVEVAEAITVKQERDDLERVLDAVFEE